MNEIPNASTPSVAGGSVFGIRSASHPHPFSMVHSIQSEQLSKTDERRVRIVTGALEESLGPDSRNREARMRSLIDAALALFAEEGYGPVSTRRIAESAGCSETLLFRYFGGKHGLLQAISRDLLEANDRETVVQATFDDVGDYIEWYLISGFDRMRTRASALKVIISALVNEPEMAAEFSRRHDEAVSEVATELRRFQKSGGIARHFDVEAVATGIEEMRFAVGFLLQIVYKRPKSELDGVAKNCALAFTHGLQGDIPMLPVPDALRRETIQAANLANDGLTRIVELLTNWDKTNGAVKAVPARRSKTNKTPSKARTSAKRTSR